MNIAFATTRLTEYDAASNATAAIAEQLSKENTVDLYAFSIEREISENVRQYNYTRKNEHNLSSVIFATIKVHDLAKKFSKYDIVILVGPDITILPSIHLAKRFNSNLKLVWDFHGLTPLQLYKSFREAFLTNIRQIFYFWSMKQSDHIIVDSAYIKKEVESKIGKKNIEVIPIGINTTRFKSADEKVIREKYHLNDKFVIIYVGRLAAPKQVDFLINAVHALDDTVLLVVGSGDEKNKLEDLAYSLDLNNRVIFTGKVSDEMLPKYYATSDVFVTASLHEGFCVPIIESFASGKPVIVPNRTAMPEVIGDAGLVYDDSLEDFVNKVKMLRVDYEHRRILSQKALERAKYFDVNEMCERYQELLEEIMRDFN